jgi:hypothetical protein
MALDPIYVSTVLRNSPVGRTVNLPVFTTIPSMPTVTTATGTITFNPGKLYMCPVKVAATRMHELYLRSQGQAGGFSLAEPGQVTPAQAARRYLVAAEATLGQLAACSPAQRAALAANLFQCFESMDDLRGLEFLFLSLALCLDFPDTRVPKQYRSQPSPASSSNGQPAAGGTPLEQFYVSLFDRLPAIWEKAGGPVLAGPPAPQAKETTWKMAAAGTSDPPGQAQTYVALVAPVLDPAALIIHLADLPETFGTIGPQQLMTIPDLRNAVSALQVQQIGALTSAEAASLTYAQCVGVWKYGGAIVGGVVGAVVGAVVSAPAGGAGAAAGAGLGISAGGATGDFVGTFVCQDSSTTSSSSSSSSGTGATTTGGTPDGGTSGDGTSGGGSSGGGGSSDGGTTDGGTTDGGTATGPNGLPPDFTTVLNTATIADGNGLQALLLESGFAITLTALPQLNDTATLAQAGIFGMAPALLSTWGLNTITGTINSGLGTVITGQAGITVP